MSRTTTANRTRRPPTRSEAPSPSPPLSDEQRAALDVLHGAAQPGFRLLLGPVGSDIQLAARVERTKRYGYGAPTAILFLDELSALDGLTRTEFRVLLRVLARAPFGDNVAPISAAALVVHHTARGDSGGVVPRCSTVTTTR
jgi:hypothetical protein